MFADFLKDLDMFGGTIRFTFRGKSSYNTVYGGVMTLVSLLFLIFFYTIKSIDFFLKLDPIVSMVENV